MQKTKSSSLAFDWRNSDSSIISNFFSLNLEKFQLNERNFYTSYLKAEEEISVHINYLCNSVSSPKVPKSI
jgi:hypothetical protein